MATAIEVTGLSKSFGRTRALAGTNVSLLGDKCTPALLLGTQNHLGGAFTATPELLLIGLSILLISAGLLTFQRRNMES